MSHDEVTEKGIVKAVDGKKITITRLDSNSCGSCGMHGICGIKNQPEFVVFSETDVSVGDTIDLIVSPSAKILSAFLVFMLPIIFMFIFYIVAQYLLNFNEKLSILISFAGLLISGIFIKFFDKKLAKRNEIIIKKRDSINENLSQ